ncbi:MAG: hypothetical protein JXM69_14460 [Anaerolineae bacterium]|nr:hypothetical protein [Anaerolineae bacterium]
MKDKILKKFWRFIIVIIVSAVLVWLSVIPISTAPVVPRPVYTFKLIALIDILAHPVGIWYKWEWYTVAVILALLTAGGLAVVFALKRFNRFLTNLSEVKG